MGSPLVKWTSATGHWCTLARCATVGSKDEGRPDGGAEAPLPLASASAPGSSAPSSPPGGPCGWIRPGSSDARSSRCTGCFPPGEVQTALQELQEETGVSEARLLPGSREPLRYIHEAFVDVVDRTTRAHGEPCVLLLRPGWRGVGVDSSLTRGRRRGAGRSDRTSRDRSERRPPCYRPCSRSQRAGTPRTSVCARGSRRESPSLEAV